MRTIYILSTFVCVAVILATCFVATRHLPEQLHLRRTILTYDSIQDLRIPESRAIPRLMFRTSHFALRDLPAQIRAIFERDLALNPGFSIVYFDDKDCRRFIEDNFPEYLAHYDALAAPAYKSDLWRLLVLYKYGGVYNDIGHEYLVPLESFLNLQRDELLLVRDVPSSSPHALAGDNTYRDGFYNAFMASYPRNPFLKRFIEVVAGRIERREYGRHPLDVVSCWVLGRFVYRYFLLDPAMTFIDQEYVTGLYGDRARILYLSPSQKDRHPSIYDRNRRVLNIKFPNYYTIIYGGKRSGLRYGDLWNARKIYH